MLPPGDLCFAGFVGGLVGFFGLKSTVETIHRLRTNRLKQGLKELTKPVPPRPEDGDA